MIVLLTRNCSKQLSKDLENQLDEVEDGLVLSPYVHSLSGIHVFWLTTLCRLRPAVFTEDEIARDALQVVPPTIPPAR